MTRPKGNANQPKQSTLSLQVTDDLTVQVFTNFKYEFLMSSADVAKGYGVARNTISWHATQNGNEFKEGIHYVKNYAVSITDREPANKLYWTKVGIVRLGMFIRSERAKMFRDWAEKILVKEIESPKPLHSLPPARKGKHNRLTQERIIGILSDVCLIEDRKLRERIASKITGDYYNQPKQLELFNPLNA